MSPATVEWIASLRKIAERINRFVRGLNSGFETDYERQERRDLIFADLREVQRIGERVRGKWDSAHPDVSLGIKRLRHIAAAATTLASATNAGQKAVDGFIEGIDPDETEDILSLLSGVPEPEVQAKAGWTATLAGPEEYKWLQPIPLDIPPEFMAVCRRNEQDPRVLVNNLQASPAPKVQAGVANQNGAAPIEDSEARQPRTFRELATLIRRIRPRLAPMARLFDLVHKQDEIEFDTLKETVHQATVEDDTVKKKITGARELVKAYKLPFELVISDRRLLRRDK